MTERLTDEAALAMARETAGKAYVDSIPDICDEDREMWLYAYRAGRWKNSPSVQSALAAIRAIEDRHAAEIAAKDAEIARLQTAQYWWDAEDGENASDDVTIILDNYAIGEVVRLTCARNLPDEWGVSFVNDSGGFEASTFATEAEADAFVRAALTDTGAA